MASVEVQPAFQAVPSTQSTTTTPTKTVWQGSTTTKDHSEVSTSRGDHMQDPDISSEVNICPLEEKASLDSAPGPSSAAEACPIVSTSQPSEKLAEAPFADEMREPWMSAEDLKVLQRRVEWYFSDTSLSTDQAFHHKISQNLPQGWLCCSELMRLETLRQLGATPELLVKCLRTSHLETKVTLTADEIRKAAGKPKEFGNRGIFVRRRQPLPPLLSKERLDSKGQAAVADPAAFVLVDRHMTMNRLRDLWRVQRQLKLNEVGDDTTVFRENILPNVAPQFRPPNMKPIVFAVGYERVIYGDHGPYIEFSESQIRWKAWPHYFDKTKFNAYFHEYYTRASHSIWEAKWNMWIPNPTKGVLMMYAQSRAVSDRPWAPGAGSDPHAGRPTGYADYRPGYFYVTADSFFVTAEKQAQSQGEA